MASSGPKRLTPPSPPADFGAIDLAPVHSPQLEYFRLAHKDHASPLFFSQNGLFRFDSSSARWGVCYLAQDVETAFLEVFADAIRARKIDYAELHDRFVWKIVVPRNLNLLSLAGPTLTKIKATVQSFVSRYSISQAWGRAFMDHPADLDGVIYKGRQSAGDCVALFGNSDPAKGRLHQRSLKPMKLGRLTEWSRFYRFIDQTGAKVKKLPPTRPSSKW